MCSQAVLAIDDAALSDALRQLETAGLLLRTDTPKNVSYTFKHALIQDAAYNSLLKGGRKQYPRRHRRGARRDPATSSRRRRKCSRATTWRPANFERAAAYWCQRGRTRRRALRQCGGDRALPERAGRARSHVPRGAGAPAWSSPLRIGLAAGLRITDRLAEALAELGTAEAVAIEHERFLELSRIHHLRGNIYYPLGRIETCFAEHQAASNYAPEGRVRPRTRRARSAGSAMPTSWRAASGRLISTSRTAWRSRARTCCCSPRLRTCPCGRSRTCTAFDSKESLEDCRAVIDLVTRVGQARGELISRSTSGWILVDKHEFDARRRARPQGPRSR